MVICVISLCVCLCLYEWFWAKGEKELSFFHLGQSIPENQLPETIFVFFHFLCPFLIVSCSHTCFSFIPSASVLFIAPATPMLDFDYFPNWSTALSLPSSMLQIHSTCCSRCDYGTNQNASASQAKYISQYHWWQQPSHPLTALSFPSKYLISSKPWLLPAGFLTVLSCNFPWSPRISHLPEGSCQFLTPQRVEQTPRLYFPPQPSAPAQGLFSQLDLCWPFQ